MKKLIIFLFSIFLCFNALAQLEVKPNSFKMIPGFVNQNTEIYDDDNNVLYAVIKVKTEKLDNKQRHQLLFDGNAATFIELEYKQDEIWVYLSSTPATYLKISHPDFGSTEFEFPFDLEPQKGYEMVLVNKTLSAYGTGSLTINTEPKGAKIQLNGYEVKQETPYSNDMIAAGRYEITVSKASYKTITQTIVIKDGDNITLNLEMMVDVAMITINADNETEVYIDNTFMKSGTWSGELYSGQHKVSLKNPCYRTLTKTITVEALKPATYSFELEPINGKITVKSQPSGATVYIDDKNYGVTPLEINGIIIGKHLLKLTKDGMKTKHKQFNMVEGVTANLDETMEILPEGAINGLFSISDTQQILFSKGNLQYQPSTDKWRFAENQWYCVGEADTKYSSDYSGWIDMFGWGTGGDPLTSSRHYIFLGFVEWGINPISNGGNEMYRWKTLTKEEWDYVLNKRHTYSGITHTTAEVNGMPGCLLYPDYWTKEIEKSRKDKDWDATSGIKKISLSDWNTVFEPNGAVFLPYSGLRFDDKTRAIGSIGLYWSSTYVNNQKERIEGAYYMIFGGADFKPYQLNPCFYGPSTGESVRLVYNDEVPIWEVDNTLSPKGDLENCPQGAINGVFSVSDKDKILFSRGNLQYQPSTKTWRFAEQQWDDNDNRYKSFVPKEWKKNGLWMGSYKWGSGNNPTITITSKDDLAHFSDWGKCKIVNGEKKIWRTLTKKEWDYVVNKRKTASGIRFVMAQVNDVGGIILFPDSWQKQIYRLNYVNEINTRSDANKISMTDWIDKFEANGAVFIPYGFYWTSTPYHTDNTDYYSKMDNLYDAYYIKFQNGTISIDYTERNKDLSARLVCPVK